MLQFNHSAFSIILTLAAPLLLAGCGDSGLPPDADGCFTEVLKATGKDPKIAKRRMSPLLGKMQTKIDRKFKDGVRYQDPVYTCVKEVTKKVYSQDPVIAKQQAEKEAAKAKERKRKKIPEPQQYNCEAIVRYCPKAPKV